MRELDLSGLYMVTLEDGSRYQAHLPGTLDENQIGLKDADTAPWHPDVELTNDASRNPVLNVEGVITGRLTRKYTYEGKVAFERSFSFREQLQERENRIFLFAERSRKLKTILNGMELLPYEEGTLSTPWCYEVTGIIKEENQLCFISDNSYEGWPASAIKYSSAATDESQTNWNGLLGKIGIQICQVDFISEIAVYAETDFMTVKMMIDASLETEKMLVVESPVLEKSIQKKVLLHAGRNEVIFTELPLRRDGRKWDEYEGNLYELTVKGDHLETSSTRFGIRKFGDSEGAYLTCNGRRIFLRCETNVGLFPEMGHTPMSRSAWSEILKTYQSYGINCVRFHSWCPPEELFCAADEAGMLVQAELSNWDPHTAFETEESFEYYKTELLAVLRTYASHPSFVMLTLGNELHCNETGRKRMTELLQLARKADQTRLFAIASNPFYGDQGTDQDSDFFTASGFYGEIMRGTSSGMEGHLNHGGNGTCHNYDLLMRKIRTAYQKPVFAFEAGQYEILPDFEELSEFHGAAVPANLSSVKEQVVERGFFHEWEKRVSASGELALIAYREEIEAVMRTPELSGISLLGLQDFTGQGTALIGMLNSHLQSKPYPFARSERFRSFFCAALPLAEMKKRTYSTEEDLEVHVLLANYGKADISGPIRLRIVGKDKIQEEILCQNIFSSKGSLTDAGVYSFSLKKLQAPARYDLLLDVEGLHNEYAIWVYPSDKTEMFSNPVAGGKNGSPVIVTGSKEEAWLHLQKGDKVLYSPKAEEEHFPGSVKTCFTTDFWSVGTFAFQEGYMGILVDPASPVFQDFPTEFHANWQWYYLTTESRAMVMHKGEKPLIEVLDCYARLRNLAFAVEYQAGEGKILISSMGLLEKQQYPEVRAMLRSLIRYMESDDFDPVQKITSEELL